MSEEQLGQDVIRIIENTYPAPIVATLALALSDNGAIRRLLLLRMCLERVLSKHDSCLKKLAPPLQPPCSHIWNTSDN